MFKKKAMPKIVGIDIQKNCIRYCTKRKERFIYGEMAVNGTIFKEDKLRHPERFEETFNQIAKELNLRNFGIVMNTQNSRLLIRQVPLNNMKTEKEIREYLYFELGETIPLPFEDPIFDLLILERSKKKQAKLPKGKQLANSKKQENESKEQPMVIQRNRFAVNGKVPVVITPEATLIEVGDSVAKSGNKLVGVDCSSLAYTRMFQRQINWSENFVLVELNSGTATITFFEELVPTYVQYEDYNQINWKYLADESTVEMVFKESTELESLESLAASLQAIIQFYLKEVSPQCTISKVYLVGGHPWVKGQASQLFQAHSDVPVKPLVSKISEGNKKRMPDRFLLAAGLASKEV